MSTNKTENMTLNLPALKIANGGIAVKKEKSNKQIASFDINAVAKKNSISNILKKDSIKQEMHEQQLLHRGLDLVLMGDLTGSMCNYHSILKRKFSEICSTLFQIIPNLKIGIIFYLDHGSGDPYITKVQKLTANVEELQSFINQTPDGNGGDSDEAVEDALNDALEMNWSYNSKHSVVLFGDAGPHEPNCCPYGYDYFEIVKNLFQKDVIINSVFCSNSVSSNAVSDSYEIEIGDFTERVCHLSYMNFFSWIANVTGGVAIGAEQIDDIIEIIKAMAAKDAGKFEELETEIRKTFTRPIPALEHIKERAKVIENKRKQLLIGCQA